MKKRTVKKSPKTGKLTRAEVRKAVKAVREKANENS